MAAEPGIERQSLGEQERAELECVRKLMEVWGDEYREAVTTAILAHAGRPGPVPLGKPCEKLKEMKR
jgi:hypothetical protein